MPTCIFCKIIQGELQSEIVFQDNDLLAFKDRYPKAKVHLLIIPKVHIKSLREVSKKDQGVVHHIINSLPAIALQAGLEQGFKTIINTGPGGGQEIEHLHFHILGGSFLKEGE